MAKNAAKDWCDKLNESIDINTDRRVGAYNVKIATTISQYIETKLDDACWTTMD